MPENTTWLIAASASAGALVMDLYHTRRHKKLEKILDIRDDQVKYLIDIIVRSEEVELDEFDMIALENLNLLKNKQ